MYNHIYMILYDFICIHNLGISYPVIHCNPVPWHGSFRCPGPAPFVLDAGHGFRGGFSDVGTGTGGSGAGAHFVGEMGGKWQVMGKR